ncbi:MAG TPA: hydrolase 1, exosortase A system-associated [Noviherbaspirillum sp.]|nr:hydrolase 1, exosortase A system-associated [Noviherbaspirillum sp.]
MLLMHFEERPLCFPCHQSWLYGVLGVPSQPRSRGVVIIVGGPQYRVGSHRQFTLLARAIAVAGYPVLRFDYRGMGDSDGSAQTFDTVNADVCCAIDHMIAELPCINEIVIWGLCDGASAAVFYANQDPRVKGLVLANPWVRTEEGIAKTYLKHYYLSRLFDSAFWKKIFNGSFQFIAAGKTFIQFIGKALCRQKSRATISSSNVSEPPPLPDRVFDGLSRFSGRVLLIMSGNDLTAKEFLALCRSSKAWRKLLRSPHISRLDLPDADHTFARREWHDQAANGTKDWLRGW